MSPSAAASKAREPATSAGKIEEYMAAEGQHVPVRVDAQSTPKAPLDLMLPAAAFSSPQNHHVTNSARSCSAGLIKILVAAADAPRLGKARMNLPVKKFLSALVALIFSATSAFAQLFQQFPVGNQGGVSGIDNQNRIQGYHADNFQFGVPTEIGSIQWWGSETDPASDLILIIFADAGGFPGQPRLEMDARSDSRTLTTEFLGDGIPRYSYTAVLETPFRAAANQTYWLTILHLTTPPTRWLWEFGSGPTGDAAAAQFNVVTQTWSPIPSDLAFAIHAIPEPATHALLLAAAAAVVIKKKCRLRIERMACKSPKTRPEALNIYPPFQVSQADWLHCEPAESERAFVKCRPHRTTPCPSSARLAGAHPSWCYSR